MSLGIRPLAAESVSPRMRLVEEVGAAHLLWNTEVVQTEGRC